MNARSEDIKFAASCIAASVLDAGLGAEGVAYVSGGRTFAHDCSYRMPERKAVFRAGRLTAKVCDYPRGQIETSKESGYTNGCYRTIID